MKKFIKTLASLIAKLDKFTLSLVCVVSLAVIIPVYGHGYEVANSASKAVVALLFFLHGVKLSPQSLWSGLTHWRLHLLILFCTFALFPLLGLILSPALRPLVDEKLYLGILFLCTLPSTVQSSIAFTSIAGGNVAAAICAASISSILGVLITPVLTSLLLGAASGGFSVQAIIDLCQQLVAPFLLGQILRPWLWPRLEPHKSVIGKVDRLSVLFIVYVSFSHGTTSGLWQTLSPSLFLALIAACAILLSLALFSTSQLALRLGFNRPDRTTILFCGSKKSLVTGVPMANVIFPPALAATIILPLMVFHQMQLMACAFIAKKLAEKEENMIAEAIDETK